MWNSFTPGNVISKMLELETARIVRPTASPVVRSAVAQQRAGRALAGVLEPWTVNWYKQDPRRLYAENTGRPIQAEGRNSPSCRCAATEVGSAPITRYCCEMLKCPSVARGRPVVRVSRFRRDQGFTGYLQPGNYEIFRDSAAQHGVLDRNKEFAWASGKFQLACYKERSKPTCAHPVWPASSCSICATTWPRHALVGVVDPFWNPRVMSPPGSSAFCGPTVPLARMHITCTERRRIRCGVEIAHYGQSL